MNQLLFLICHLGRICVGLYIFTSPILVQAQDAVYRFHHLNRDDGLTSQDHNLYIFQDSRGFVWISSLLGLNRFDSKTIKPYVNQKKDSTSLFDNNIHSRMFEDESSNLWFTTNSAIHCYIRDQDHFQRYRLSKDTLYQHDEYQLLFLDKEKKELWVRNKKQLYVCPMSNPSEAELMGQYPFILTSEMIQHPETKNLLLILPLKDAGLQIFERIENDFEPFRILPKEDFPFKVSSCFIENEDKIWVGTSNGLFLIDSTSGFRKVETVYNGKTIHEITDILEWNDQRLLLSTYDQGLYFFDRSSHQITGSILSDERDRLVSFPYQVDRMYKSEDGTFWISSRATGVFYTHPAKRKFQVFLPEPDNKANDRNFVRALVEDEKGRIICFTRNGIASFTETGTLVADSEVPGSSLPFYRQNIYSSLLDQSSGLWVCTQAGMYLKESGKKNFEKVPIQSESPSKDFIYIHQLSDGTILGTSNGIYRAQKQSGRWRMNLLDNLSNPEQRYAAIFEGPDKKVYVSKYNAELMVFQLGDQKGQLTLLDSIPLKPMVNGMAPLKEQKGMWLGTDQGLFQLLELEDGFALKAVEGAPFQTINGLLVDDSSYLWISSNEGLARLHSTGEEWELFDLSDGLQGLEFNYWSALKTRKGDLLFGGVTGVTIIHPSEIEALRYQVRPSIVEINLHNGPLPQYVFSNSSTPKNITEIKKLLFRNEDNSLSFRFSAMDYTDPQSATYQYSLFSGNGELIDSGNQDQVTYANMKAGEYELRLSASNSDGKWANMSDLHTLSFTILPHWTASWWFRTLLIFIILGVFFAIYRNRIAHARKQRQIAEFKLLVSEAETAILRVQMNPHFIFNSLHSIRSYILEKDIDTADNYLVQLSKLVRKILDLAAKPNIPLSTEQELLSEYMKIEALRFDQAFKYTFHLDKQIDPDEIFIPTMILQPFVENAIIHGIDKTVNTGHIQIHFWLENNQLCCSVQDNGTGRKPKQSKRKNHVSRATEITQKRLALIKQQTSQPTSLDIVDLLSEKGNASGTKVIIRLPLL